MLIKAGFRAKREAAVALSKGSVETAVRNATVEMREGCTRAVEFSSYLPSLMLDTPGC
jgi:hypothetical protein